VPWMAWGMAAVARCPGLHRFRFFAGFCLIANGRSVAFGFVTAMSCSVTTCRTFVFAAWAGLIP